MKWNTKKVAIISGVLGFAVSFAIGLRKSIKETDKQIEKDAEELAKEYAKDISDHAAEEFQKIIDDFVKDGDECVKQFEEELDSICRMHGLNMKPDSEDEAE